MKQLIRFAALAVAALPFVAARAASTDLNDVPMVVQNSVRPNVLAVFDNSQSMDAYMAGKLVTGTDPNTRGNIGRRVLTDTFNRYRSAFNWGLMSYRLQDQNPGLYNTYAYYFGDAATMVFTDDCVNGQSASNNGLGCVANPSPFAGGNFVTYARAGDDPDILDVLYIQWNFSQLWAFDGSGTCFNEYFNHAATNSWDPSTFYNGVGTFCYTPTDAGFTVSNPPYPRQFYVPRGYGYLSNITGGGVLMAPVQPDAGNDPAYPAMTAALAPETLSNSGELKNAALFTPLKGTLQDALRYYTHAGNAFQDVNGNPVFSPIAYTCQRNFVMLVTDGAPTGKDNGDLYSDSERANTYGNGGWNFGTASTEAINAVSQLRGATFNGHAYDIATYVIGLGDTVQNPSAVATLNAMAAAGGTTSAYLATNEADLLASLDLVSQDIIARDGAAASVTVSNPNVVPGDNASYQSSYNSGSWTGEPASYPVNTVTGVIDTSSPNWPVSARTQLDSSTPDGRLIATWGGSSGIQFRPASASTATKLTTAQQGVFASPTSPPGPNDAESVIAYLRGDRSNEGSLYRTRAHLLGDLIDAEPVLVRKPSWSYADPCYSVPAPGCTTAFKAVQANRTRVVFQGSNDGMLHAFAADTGRELWAYVPSLVWPTMNALTRLTGFAHLYRVDGTPTVGDVDLSVTQGSGGVPDWHTLLVGGLGKGGMGFYALDVTNPLASSEADAASKAMWEFPNATTPSSVAANVGYSFGKPILTKTQAAGWVVLVTSGYDNDAVHGNGDGQGHLYVLNARNGAVIRDIATGVGTPSSPSGLAKIAAYAVNAAVNNTVDFVYGGDLNGNVWRFDLTGPDPATWNVSRLATLVDASGATQPVTDEPQLAEITTRGTSRRFVYVGTGKYLGSSDVTTAQTQTMYGLIDDMTPTPLISPLRANLVQQTVQSTSGTTRQVSANAIDYASQHGWYLDFTLSAGERVVTDPQLASGALLFTTNVPSPDVCLPGGSSWYYVLDYETGGIVPNSTQPNFSGQFLGNALASRPALMQLPDGRLMAPVHLSDGSSPSELVPVAASVAAGRRVFWKEVNTN